MLTEILLFISAVKNEIEFNRKPVTTILRESINKNCSKHLTFIPKCVSFIDSGEDFINSWKNSVAESNVCSLLNSQESDLLVSYGSQLGTTDVCGQTSMCILYERLFSEKLKSAQAYEENYGKIYRQSGIFIGAAIVILIL